MTDEGRTSRRARKQVNYSQFNADDDFDDDFAEMTPPPSKKSKVEKETKPKKLKKERKPKKERKSVDDKVYERELELALELSKNDRSENGDSTEQDDKLNPSNEKKECKPEEKRTGKGDDKEEEEEEKTDDEMPVLERANTPVKSTSPRKKRTPKKHNFDDFDKIEVLEEDVQDEVVGRKRRRAAVRAVTNYAVKDEESDEEEEVEEEKKKESQEFKIDEENESDGKEESDEDGQLEDDDDGDSDFEGHWSKSKKKAGRGRGKTRGSPRGGGRAAGNQVNKIKPRISATVHPVNKGRGGGSSGGGGGAVRPISLPKIRDSPTGRSSPSTGRSSPSSSTVRKPNWIPPARAGDGHNEAAGIKSPGGTLRLGLSRKSRVKPLHASVKVP